MNGCVPTIDKDERKNVEFIPATLLFYCIWNSAGSGKSMKKMPANGSMVEHMII